jgi:hypothetical protein
LLISNIVSQTVLLILHIYYNTGHCTRMSLSWSQSLPDRYDDFVKDRQ